MLCGASWAFILSALDVCPIYVLNRFSQRKCGGGNLSQALSDICLLEGVCKSSVSDGSWCTSPICGALVDERSGEMRETTSNSPFSAMREGYDVFNALRKERFTGEVNSIIPYIDVNRVNCQRVYFSHPFSISCNRILGVEVPRQAEENADLLDNNTKASGVSVDEKDIESVISTAKHTIMTNGPLFSVIPIYDNFLDRNYTDTGGVYFDQVPYSNRDATRFRGCLAVCVVGWGRKEISGTFSTEVYRDGHVGTDQMKKANVEYWICKTALGGYFSEVLIPMRVNTRCQLESYRMFKLPNDEDGWSGTFITGGFHGVYKKGSSDTLYPAIVSSGVSSNVCTMIALIFAGVAIYLLLKK